MATPVYKVVEVQGFRSGEVAFQDVVQRQDARTVSLLMTLPLCLNDANTNNNKFCSITIVGYSDRDDTPGISDVERRKKEDLRAMERASSASSWLRVEFFKLFTLHPLDDLTLRDRRNIAVNIVSAGAGSLNEMQPGNNERLRQTNRRVVFYVTAQDVGHINDIQGDRVTIPPR
jgi:hypothetical protein